MERRVHWLLLSPECVLSLKTHHPMSPKNVRFLDIQGHQDQDGVSIVK
jgi:hypothetical protein